MNKTHFHMKDFALGLALKQRRKTTRKSPIKEALSVLMLCAPNNRRRPFSYHAKMADFEHFRVLSVFS